MRDLHTENADEVKAKSSAPRFFAKCYAEHLHHFARYGSPAKIAYSGKNGTIWKQLFDSFGHDELKVIIQLAVKNKERMQFGDWKGSRLTAAHVLYYANHWYESRADREATKKERSERELPLNVLAPNGVLNENAITNYARVCRLSRDEVLGRIETALHEKAGSGRTSGNGEDAEA
jgi:hypothetical protein